MILFQKKMKFCKKTSSTTKSSCTRLQTSNRIFKQNPIATFYFVTYTKKPVKYCYLTGIKQKTNTMNKHLKFIYRGICQEKGRKVVCNISLGRLMQM